ncbi:hypothetical protein Tco_0097299 [Tanacetum coccineum]
MVDVPIHQEDPVVQRTRLIYTVISMVTEKSTPTPPPPTTETQATPASESDMSLKFEQRLLELEKKVELLPKAVLDFVKQRMESTVRDVLQKNPINLFKPSSSSTSINSFTEYELKNMLYDKMQKSGSFSEHEKHLDLYNALIGSINLDKAIAKGEIDPTKVLKKRRHDDKDDDPPADSKKKKKKR